MNFGLHFMLDGYGAPKSILKDEELIKNMLQTIPGELGMYAITDPIVVEVGPNNKKDPGGISGMVLIAESHISVHTFPNRAFVTLDVYTCQDTLDTKSLIEKFQHHLQFNSFEKHLIKRGVRYPNRDTQ